ncbi:metallophosphoesterase family protein [Bacteroides faecium]|uniref:Metallophosphoesterase family protein n=1 Tax=Bacteroides faecium TaxID=2715212 RepID=A0A6H0KLI0_9BACE|nr:metallophosphoesterase family protein [Bacteroides faecium]QIU94232.1 metallophosphoesterase family protein [Bacteroides faecium]
MIRLLKFHLTLILLLATTFGMAQKSELKFSKDGKFKIVQFTDVHFKYGNPASDVALERINQVLDAERPDLVVFTGDVVYAAPADSGMLKVLEQVSKRKLPFVVTFGNHDNEQGMTREQLYDIIRTVPGNLLPDRGTALSPDYVLTVKSSSDSKKDAALLYCMDTHSYSLLEDVKGYDWLTFDQINWYRQQSAAYKAQNGGQPLPALAFFHIPLPEYHEAIRDENAAFRGTRMEEACAPRINTGMFAAMKEAGDVMGVFVGHDHDNDYAVMWKNILLAYGRYTGGNTVYNHLPNGARIIVLDEGARTFTSWIRQKDGIVDKVSYPASFVKDDWTKR